MPYLLLDDKQHAHRKTRRAVRSSPDKRRDAAAMGLWVLAASWCADNLTDGFVPLDELDQWDDDGEALAERLVAAGYWHADTDDDERGFRFVNWTEHNPDAASVKAKRAAESEGGKLGNHRRWHVPRRLKVPGCSLCDSGADVADIAPESGTRSGGRVPPESSQSHPTPSPSQSSSEATVTRAPFGSGLTDDDLDNIARRTNGDRAYAAAIAADILDRAGQQVRKPLAYVLRAIAEEPDRYRKARGNPRPGDPGECDTHAGQWADTCRSCAADRIAGDR